MNGIVDRRGRALLTIPIRTTADGPETPVDLWVDTGLAP